MEKNYRICIVGPGAIGGVVASVLCREGFDITLVTKHKDLAEKISTSGMEVSGYCGSFTQSIPAVATCEELEGIFDYVLIVTRGDALEEVARGILPYLDKNSRVVSMQNGICEDTLARVVGVKRTIGCVVGWGGTLHEPGIVEMTSGGECILGNWKQEPDDELENLAGIMSHVINTRISRIILSELYSKMIINSCITTLGVICGLYLGEILAKRKARKLFIQVIREAINVAWAMGITVAPGAEGKLDYYKFVTPGFLSGTRRHLIIRIIGKKYRKIKSSSLQSLERGKKTEVENYNGYISDKGRKFHIPTPVNNQLTQMVIEIESGERQITPANLKELKL